MNQTRVAGGKFYTNNCNLSIDCETIKQQEIVGNKAKGRISKWVFQESKARQNIQKTNISYLLIRACQEVRNVCFSEILVCFAFLKHPF